MPKKKRKGDGHVCYCTWTVGTATPNPVLTNPGNQVNSVGDDVDLQLSATDNGGYTLTYTATGLPAGLSLDPAGGTITGTIAASAANATPYSVTVMASDGSASQSQTFSWSVSAVSLTSPGDQTNLDGAAVNLPVTATDAASGTLTYGATGLPPGLTVTSAGSSAAPWPAPPTPTVPIR